MQITNVNNTPNKNSVNFKAKLLPWKSGVPGLDDNFISFLRQRIASVGEATDTIFLKVTEKRQKSNILLETWLIYMEKGKFTFDNIDSAILSCKSAAKEEPIRNCVLRALDDFCGRIELLKSENKVNDECILNKKAKPILTLVVDNSHNKSIKV